MGFGIKLPSVRMPTIQVPKVVNQLVNVAKNPLLAGPSAITTAGLASMTNNLGLGTPKVGAAVMPTGSNASNRDTALEAGYARGQKEFYDDPDMQMLRKLRENMAQGYDSSELGALRGSARAEIAGQRAQDQRQMASQLARGGVGGARAAAMQNAAAQKSGAQVMDAERKMALDSAGMKRQGTGDLQDFLFRQKYGKMGTGIGEAQLQGADYQAEQARLANNQKKDRGLVGDLLSPLFG
jgi:hypothetical protein